MTFFQWLESKIKHLHWYDISLIKLSTAAFILLLAKICPALLALEWYIYLIIGLLAAAVPLSILFSRHHD